MPIRPDSIVIRQLTAEDAPAFQALRLAALEACPTAFGASVEDEPALALYRRLGFVIYGEEPEGLCVNGEYQNEYLMSLALA